MVQFPFPDEISAYDELRRDSQFSRVPPSKHKQIVSDAWKRGLDAANTLFNNCSVSVYDVLRDQGMLIQRIDADCVIGSTRYFAEFFEKRKEIVIYSQAINLFATHNQLSYEHAEQLILAHELFHYLECSKQVSPAESVYQHSVIKIGKWTLLKSSLRSISEISAYGFAFGYYQTRLQEPHDLASELDS